MVRSETRNSDFILNLRLPEWALGDSYFLELTNLKSDTRINSVSPELSELAYNRALISVKSFTTIDLTDNQREYLFELARNIGYFKATMLFFTWYYDGLSEYFEKEFDINIESISKKRELINTLKSADGTTIIGAESLESHLLTNGIVIRFGEQNTKTNINIPRAVVSINETLSESLRIDKRQLHMLVCNRFIINSYERIGLRIPNEMIKVAMRHNAAIAKGIKDSADNISDICSKLINYTQNTNLISKRKSKENISIMLASVGEVRCVWCSSTKVRKNGGVRNGKQRYECLADGCNRRFSLPIKIVDNPIDVKRVI